MPTQFSTKTLPGVEVKDSTIVYPTLEALYGREEQVLAALGQAALGVIQSKSLPLPEQIIVGRFKQDDYDRFKLLSTYGISVWPLPMSRLTLRNLPAWITRTTAAVPLIATVTGQTVAFTGASIGGLNIAALFGHPQQSVVVSSIDTDTPATIATKLTAALNAISGITAVASAATVTLTGAQLNEVRVGGQATLTREVERIAQSVQLTVWAGTRELRSKVGDALRSALGVQTRPFIDLGDGTAMRVTYQGHRWLDDDQIDSLWAYHLRLFAEYPTMETQPAYQIVAIDATISATNHADLTIHI